MFCWAWIVGMEMKSLVQGRFEGAKHRPNPSATPTARTQTRLLSSPANEASTPLATNAMSESPPPLPLPLLPLPPPDAAATEIEARRLGCSVGGGGASAERCRRVDATDVAAALPLRAAASARGICASCLSPRVSAGGDCPRCLRTESSEVSDDIDPIDLNSLVFSWIQCSPACFCSVRQ